MADGARRFARSASCSQKVDSLSDKTIKQRAQSGIGRTLATSAIAAIQFCLVTMLSGKHSIPAKDRTTFDAGLGKEALNPAYCLSWFRLVSVIADMIVRGWENFIARPNGALSLRFILQPTMAGLLALRAGVQDAREGRSGYLWAMLSEPQRRVQLLHDGWRGARTPFLVAIVLDCVYQLMIHGFIYPLELLFTATLLALVPYVLLRGPFNRLARALLPARGLRQKETGSKVSPS